MISQTAAGSLIAKVPTRDENGTPYTLVYFLTIYASTSGQEVYGIKVDMLDVGDVLIKSSETFAFCEDKEKVLMLIGRFAEGEVRPHTLQDMVEEWGM